MPTSRQNQINISYFDLIIKNANAIVSDSAFEAATKVSPHFSATQNTERIFDEDPSLHEELCDIGIIGNKIAAVGNLQSAEGKIVIDARGLTILPGVIDSQVHFREPGLTHKEDLYTGTLSAILGGVTAVFEMPNTKPATLTSQDIRDKIKLAENRAWCHYGFFVGAAKENIETLGATELIDGCVGVKIFMGSSTGSLLVSSDDDLLQVLKNGKRRVAIHAEDEDRMIERKSLLANDPHVAMHPVWRDETSALRATERIIRLAKQCGRPVHILHVTTAEEMEFLAKQKQVATVEVTPQHLTLAAPECYEKLGTLAQMNPPIRDARHREALWQGIHNGTVTVIGTDHAPHTLEEKNRPYPQSPSGMPGVQTLVPIMLNHVAQKKLKLTKLVELICRNPGRLYGYTNKGEIRVGFDADLTIVDTKKEWTIHHTDMATKSGWTPYDGEKVIGKVTHTVVDGNLVMAEGKPVGQPIGKQILFS